MGVDSLAFDWGQESCWLVPPVCLIPRALMHFLNCRSRGTLVVPFWPSSLFWPYLICENGAFQDFVGDFLFVQNGAEVFVQGANKEACFGSSAFNTRSSVVFEARWHHKFISPLGVRAQYLHIICPLGLRKIMSVMRCLLGVHWDFDWFTGTCFLAYMRYSLCRLFTCLLTFLQGAAAFSALAGHFAYPELSRLASCLP